MSFVDVLPVEPVMPTTCALDCGRGRPRQAPRSAAKGVVGDERRRGAARARVVEELRRRRPTATNRSPGATRRESTCTPVISSACGARRARPEPRTPPRRARARSRRRSEPPQRLARDLAVVERDDGVAELLALLVALARDHDDVAFTRELDARAIASRRSGSTSTSASAPATISAMIASGSSLRGLSEVTIARSASSRGDPRPSAGACPGRGRRRSRTRR